jgi:hypothetical protein
MLELGSDPETTRSIWAALPRLPWAIAGQAKPGATALALVGGSESNRTDEAVVAAQAYGMGKVLWTGTSDTWRWRYRAADSYHHRFWGQVVRWAASDKLPAGTRFVRFGPVKPQVDSGEPVRLRARFLEGARVGPDLLVAARIFRAGDGHNPAAMVPLRPVAGRPEVFEGSASGLPVGSYLVRLDVPELAEPLELASAKPLPEARLDVVERFTPERIELAARSDLLDRLASETGGRVLHDYEGLQLPELLPRGTQEVVRAEEVALWDKPWALTMFFGALTLEWVLRKRAGLP